MLFSKHLCFFVDIAYLDTYPQVLNDHFGKGLYLFVDVFLIISGVDEERPGDVGVVTAIQGPESQNDAVTTQVYLISLSEKLLRQLTPTLDGNDRPTINIIFVEIEIFELNYQLL